MEMRHFKQTKFEIKALDESGVFEGYASTFGNEDLGGDVIAAGAFKKTIVEKKDVPILWGHSIRDIIGVNQHFAEDEKGLQVRGQLEIKATERAKSAYELMKMGAVKGL